MTRSASLLPLLLLAACAAPAATPSGGAPAPAPSAIVAADSGVLAVQQGGNDVFTERYLRRGDRLESHLTAVGINVRMDATLNPDASFRRVVVRQFAGAADTVPSQTLTADFRGDSVIAEGTGGGSAPQSIRQQVSPGAVLFVNPSPVLIEQIVRRARAIGGETVEVPMWIAAAGGRAGTSTVTLTADSARVQLGSVEVHVAVDARGRVTGGSIPQQGLGIVRREVGEAPAGQLEHRH